MQRAGICRPLKGYGGPDVARQETCTCSSKLSKGSFTISIMALFLAAQSVRRCMSARVWLGLCSALVRSQCSLACTKNPQFYSTPQEINKYAYLILDCIKRQQEFPLTLALCLGQMKLMCKHKNGNHDCLDEKTYTCSQPPKKAPGPRRQPTRTPSPTSASPRGSAAAPADGRPPAAERARRTSSATSAQPRAASACTILNRVAGVAAAAERYTQLGKCPSCVCTSHRYNHTLLLPRGKVHLKTSCM